MYTLGFVVCEKFFPALLDLKKKATVALYPFCVVIMSMVTQMSCPIEPCASLQESGQGFWDTLRLVYAQLVVSQAMRWPMNLE